MSDTISSLSQDFNDAELANLVANHRPFGTNNYHQSITNPPNETLVGTFEKLCFHAQFHDAKVTHVPMERFSTEEIKTILRLLDDRQVRFEFELLSNTLKSRALFITIKDINNPHITSPTSPSVVDTIKARQSAIISKINIDAFISPDSLVPISIDETDKGLYVSTRDMSTHQQLVVEASLKLRNIPYQFHRSSKHGDVLVAPYSHYQQLNELKTSIEEKLLLPKIEILKTENKGLYVPITSLSEIHRSELQGILQKNSVKFHYYNSPSQGEVLVVPYSDWSQLQQTQSEIAIKIDTLRADKENVPTDKNPQNKEYHLKVASENARSQLDNLQYLEPK